MKTISLEKQSKITGGGASGVSAGLCLVGSFVPVTGIFVASICGAAFISDTFFGSRFINF